MEDKRNFKCFFGMHQYKCVRRHKNQIFEYGNDDMPYETRFTYIYECNFCGKMKTKVVKI